MSGDDIEFCEASGTGQWESRYDRRGATRDISVCLACGKRGRRLVADGFLMDHTKPMKRRPRPTGETPSDG